MNSGRVLKTFSSDYGFAKSLALPAIVLLSVILVFGIYKIANQESKTAITTPSADRLILKEFGVQITLPDELKGVKYTVLKPPVKLKSAATILNLKLASYTTLANKCLGTASGTDRFFASLAKNNGQSLPESVTLKKFSNFHVINLGSSITKGTRCKDLLVQKSFNELSNSLNSALKSAFSSATQI